MRVESTSNPDTGAARTARYAVAAAIPNLTLTAFAAATSTSLAIRADLALTFLDMLALLAAWALATGRCRGAVSATPAAETLVGAFVASCMCLSMTVVAGMAVHRVLAGGAEPQGSGIVFGAMLNIVYAALNFWILRRWLARGRSQSSAFIRSQACLFADKLSSNILMAASLTATLMVEGTVLARFIDPAASLLIAAASARWTLPVVCDAIRSLRAYRAVRYP